MFGRGEEPRFEGRELRGDAGSRQGRGWGALGHLQGPLRWAGPFTVDSPRGFKPDCQTAPQSLFSALAQQAPRRRDHVESFLETLPLPGSLDPRHMIPYLQSALLTDEAAPKRPPLVRSQLGGTSFPPPQKPLTAPHVHVSLAGLTWLLCSRHTSGGPSAEDNVSENKWNNHVFIDFF